MDRDRQLTFSPVHHPDPKIQRGGFDIRDPYVEQCWSAVIGPSATLLLRRLPELWIEQTPAQVQAEEFAQSLGISSGTGSTKRLSATMDRLVRFGLARHGEGADHLDVHLEVAPLRPHQLERAPEWTRAAHERLLSEHIRDLSIPDSHGANVAALTARLDRLQHGGSHAHHPSVGQQQALGR